jgi:hypothetical protein
LTSGPLRVGSDRLGAGSLNSLISLFPDKVNLTFTAPLDTNLTGLGEYMLTTDGGSLFSMRDHG